LKLDVNLNGWDPKTLLLAAGCFDVDPNALLLPADWFKPDPKTLLVPTAFVDEVPKTLLLLPDGFVIGGKEVAASVSMDSSEANGLLAANMLLPLLLTLLSGPIDANPPLLAKLAKPPELLVPAALPNTLFAAVPVLANPD
jgi:hypothetical protein